MRPWNECETPCSLVPDRLTKLSKSKRLTDVDSSSVKATSTAELCDFSATTALVFFGEGWWRLDRSAQGNVYSQFFVRKHIEICETKVNRHFSPFSFRQTKNLFCRSSKTSPPPAVAPKNPRPSCTAKRSSVATTINFPFLAEVWRLKFQIWISDFKYEFPNLGVTSWRI